MSAAVEQQSRLGFVTVQFPTATARPQSVSFRASQRLLLWRPLLSPPLRLQLSFWPRPRLPRRRGLYRPPLLQGDGFCDSTGWIWKVAPFGKADDRTARAD